MITEDKVTEIFYMADDFCKFFDAMVISKKRIKAAGCILPVSHNQDIPKEFGLRHRAALGISQASDALAIIVSEETGKISIAIHGEFQVRLSAEQLESILTKELENF